MIGGDHPDAVEVKRPSSKGRDLFPGPKKQLGGKGSEGTDNLGLNGLYLFQKKGAAGRDLIRLRVPIPVIDRRYPLSDVPDAIRYLEEGHAQGKVVISVNGHSK